MRASRQLTGRARHRRAAALGVAVAVLAGVLPATTSSAAVPGAPSGLVPDDVTTTAYKNLELRWSAVSGATSYDVQISDDGFFGAGTFAGSSATSRFMAPVTLPAGDYAWRVRAVSGSTKGTWSDTGYFTRSWDAAPATPAHHVGGALPALSWAPLPDASFYEVEFSKVPFEVGDAPYEATKEHYTCYTNHTYLAPYGSVAGTENPPGNEQGCAFDIRPPEPVVVSLLGIEDGEGSFTVDGKKSTVGTGDRFGTASRFTLLSLDTAVEPDCARITDTAVDEDHTVCVGTDLKVDPRSSAYHLDGAFNPGSTYYWRVRGRDGTVDDRKVDFPAPALDCTGVWLESGAEADGDGNVTVPVGGEPPEPEYAPKPECSRWLEGGSFLVPTTFPGDADPAPSPTGMRVEPTAGDATASTVAVTDTPLFRWDPVPGAAKYRVFVGRTSDLRSADHVWETYYTSLMPVGTLPDRGLRTYWTVQACGWNTEPPVCSDPAPVRSFTKVSKVTTDADTTAVTGEHVLLTWDVQSDPVVRPGQLVPGAPAAKAYQVQVALEGDFEAPVKDLTVDRVADRTDTTSSRYSLPTSDLADGRYSWRVRPVDESGQALRWGTTGSFVVDRATPTVRIATAAGFRWRNPVRLAFSEPVSGVSASSLGVLVAGTTSKVAGTLTAVDGSSWDFTPAAPWVPGQSYSVWVSSSVVDRGAKRVTASVARIRASTTADSASPVVTAVRGDAAWATVTASDAVASSYLRTTDDPRTSAKGSVQAKLKGTVLRVYACRSPHSGVVRISVDGKAVATVDLYRAYSSCGRVWTSRRLADTTHTIVFSPTGSKRSASHGYRVALDAFSAG